MASLLRTVKVFNDGSIEVEAAQVPPPSYRVRKWGDPIMAKEYNCDVNVIKTTNFQRVCMYVPLTSTWSVVENHVVLGRAEMNALINIQTKWGKHTSDTFDQMMNWLVFDGEATRPYWGGKWKTATLFKTGTMLWGGQLVQIGERKTFLTATPGNTKKRQIEMGKVVTFTKADLAKLIAGTITPQSHPHLIPQCSAAGGNNVFNPTPRGNTMFSPIWGGEWAKVNMARDWYIPLECLEPA